MNLRQGYIDDSGVGHIPLTQRKWAFCDGHWFHILSQHNWYARYNPKSGRWYAVRNVRLPHGKRAPSQMHREIMGDPVGMEIDHIDRSPEGGLDNRESNLRIATGSQNRSNVGLRKNNASGFIGVSWHKHSNKWVVNAGFNGKKRHIGLFDTTVEAAAVYNWAAKKFHGEFAVLNDLSQVTEEQLEG